MKRGAKTVYRRHKLLLVAMCISVALAGFAVQAFGSFGKSRGFAVGSGPDSVAISDLNGDGKRDLAVANYGSGNVSVLLGNGAGSFGKAKNFAAGPHPSSIAIGKFNGDAKRDIAVVNPGYGTVSILLGHGDGTFGPATSFPASGAERSIAIGDFNRDGKRDLAAITGSGVSVLLGHGDGTFGPATNFPAGINPRSVVVGKFNADANLDLAVANGGAIDCEARVNRAQASSCIGGFGTVSVLLGHGDGTFSPAADFTVGDGTYPAAMVVGNFNADAKPDLALANFMQYAQSVSILLGKGGGAFGKAKYSPVGLWEPDSIAVGDINQDSRDDLAVAGSDSPESISVLLGRGDGAFGPATLLPSGADGAGASPTAVAIGNLNAGLNPDLAVAIADHRDRVAVRLNAGPGARKLTLAYSRNKRKFTGRLSSADPACMRGQRVKVLRRLPGRDQKVGAAITSKSGSYSIRRNARRGTYYARVRSWSACRARNSNVIALR
jgi:hypothetical protein